MGDPLVKKYEEILKKTNKNKPTFLEQNRSNYAERVREGQLEQKALEKKNDVAGNLKDIPMNTGMFAATALQVRLTGQHWVSHRSGVTHDKLVRKYPDKGAIIETEYRDYVPVEQTRAQLQYARDRMKEIAQKDRK